MGISEKKLYFDVNKFNTLEKNASILFTSNEYFSWFKTSITGKDILLKLNGKKVLAEVIEEIAEEYRLPKDLIEKDICKFCKASLDNNIIFESKNSCQEVKFNNNIRSIFLDITNECNLNCLYCNKNICNAEKATFLKVNNLKIYLDKITKENNGASILFNVSGGEPLLHKDIEGIFKVIRNYDCRIALWTNGILLNEDKANLINEYCDYVMLSLDDTDKDSNDKIRGFGSYDAVMKSSKLCIDKEIPFFIVATPTKYNIEALDKFISFSYDIGAEGFMINEPILIKEDETDISQHFDYSIDKLQSKYVYMRKRTSIINSWKNSRLKFNKENKTNLIFVEDIKRCMNSIFNISFKESCGAGVNEILIDTNGQVFPCHALNIKKYSLGSVDQYISNKKEFVKTSSITSCNNCNYSIFCLGGCRAQALFHTKNIDGKYPSCNYEKENYKQILWSPLKAIEMKE